MMVLLSWGKVIFTTASFLSAHNKMPMVGFSKCCFLNGEPVISD